MPFLGKEQRPWLGGAISVLAGTGILFFMIYMPAARHFAVESVNAVLSYPEKPALYVRNLVQLSGNWVLERASLNERVEQLELRSQSLAEALQRAGVREPAQRESYVRAVVTLRYPQDWWQEFRIDKGSRDGVAENAAVTSEGYLVGRVARVGESYAWVELITSSSFLLAVAVDQTRDLGVVNGDDFGHLKLLYIPEERGLKRGMTISTSLMSDMIPPGLPIGTIIDIDENREGYREMRLSAGAHLTQLYNVEVFTGKGRTK
ncbi:MAG: rod shape-determining protein MreC [Synergistaceae bacterium]|nr:rod shape-determining protein MreC [Synergistaceae bacterium]